MKKFIAVIFLMIYGLTSVKASGGIHLCGNKFDGSISHGSNCVLDYYSTCCSQSTHRAANFCKDDHNLCAIEKDSNTTEPPTQKLLIIDSAFVFSNNSDEAKQFIFLLHYRASLIQRMSVKYGGIYITGCL